MPNYPAMNSQEIRETYLSFFEQEGHLRMPSASLVPAETDASVLLTTAGMQPFKPYFRGQETPPRKRLTSVQKCFRTTDMDEVGKTARHLTMFEMLGNFSFGDYFKEEAIGFGYRLAIDGFGFKPEQVWMTVFGGDDELGLGPDEDAIAYWQALGVPDTQIVRLGRSDNFWQAGPVGPCGPCSELYLDRGLEFGARDDLPGDDSERFLEFWNLVFMQYELGDGNSISELPAKNIDTGMGLERMAAILQDKPSVYETDNFWPLIELGQDLSGARYLEDPASTRAMRVLANHSRSMAFLIADGVVPSNEDRGYVLRRIMRRAIQQGRTLGIERSLVPFAERVIEVMGEPYPELRTQKDAILQWARAEEEAFGRTLAQGTDLLNQLIADAKKSQTSWIDAADAFQLHDTFGFPYDMTKELLGLEGLSVDDEGFDELMDQQRDRARSGSKADVHSGGHEAIQKFARSADRQSEFVGYADLEHSTSVISIEPRPGSDDESLIKLAESVFYAEGGGQVSDRGSLSAEGASAEVVDVFRVGDDQVIAATISEGQFTVGQQVTAKVNKNTRFATATHHTATHLLHAALRERLGTHVRQAGSAVRPDKLRFDFTHGAPMSADDVAAVEDRVNGWIADNHAVHAVVTTKAAAEDLGAMALFGEKYGDQVRMVEVGDGIDAVSRELCGGTHVKSTGEIGVFSIVVETSSAANVRRIEALAGPAAANRLRERERELKAIADQLRTRPDLALGAVLDREAKLKKLQKAKSAGAGVSNDLIEELGDQASEIAGLKALVAQLDGDAIGADAVKELRSLGERLRDKFSADVVVLGASIEGRVQIVALSQPAAVEVGVKAGALAKLAAETVGGGGGGKDNLAQAGGKDAAKLPEALDAVRAAIAAAAG
ncbi:MAG: alanine--tRNA ligase [Solirubrobacterales bacterium]|nr:alanine--tRNA ligase [Solirubrobacterales bacterium]